MTFTRPASQTALLDLSGCESCLLWLESFKSPATKKNYSLHLQLFCRFHTTTPDELLKTNPQELKILIIKYVLYLKKNAKPTPGKPVVGEISANSIKTYLNGVRHFLDFHEIELSWRQIFGALPEDGANEYRAYTIDEIKQILSLADIRMRVVILLQVSSGIRVGALPTLKFKHLMKVPEHHGVGILTVYAESKKSRYPTLVTPECMMAIEAYRDHRKQMGEKITDESYIIRDRFAHMSSRTNRPKPLKVSTLTAQMRRIVRKALPKTDELQTDHGFRKYFNTALMNSDVSYSFKELFLGHSIDLDEVYYDMNTPASKEKILSEYMKAVNFLTINEENRLKMQVETLRIKKDELNEMKARMDMQEKQLKEYVATAGSIEAAKENKQWREKIHLQMEEIYKIAVASGWMKPMQVQQSEEESGS